MLNSHSMTYYHQNSPQNAHIQNDKCNHMMARKTWHMGQWSENRAANLQLWLVTELFFQTSKMVLAVSSQMITDNWKSHFYFNKHWQVATESNSMCKTHTSRANINVLGTCCNNLCVTGRNSNRMSIFHFLVLLKKCSTLKL